MTRILLAALALLTALPAAAQLSKTETAIAAAVDKDSDRTIALLQRMVDQNSGSLNLPGVTAVADMVRPEFEALGFEVRWSDMSATGRAGHVIATHRGNGKGKRILLIGHLDTVFEPSSPFQKFVRTGDKATGPGVLDDKGGVVVIIAALRAMHSAGTLKDADIVVVLTGDEERTGAPADVARKDLIDAGKWADVAFEYENLAREGGQDYGTVARRSSTSWTIIAKGKTGHSSGIFGDNLGYGAIYELARILDSFRRDLREPNLTYNVGVIGGGTPATMDDAQLNIQSSGKTNIVAETAIARGDVRSLTPEQDARVRTRMTGIVAQSLPGTSATIVFSDGYPSMPPTTGNRALLGRLNEVNKSLGLPAMPEYDPAKRGAADSSWVAADVDTLAGMGPAGGGAHAEGEWIDLPSISLMAKRNAILLTRLSRERR